MTAQRRPKRLQDGPRNAQNSPGGVQDSPGGAQDGPNGGQDSPRGAQEGPRRLPKRPRQPPREPPRGLPRPSENDFGTRPLKITKNNEKPMVFQHFWGPEPTPHRPTNRPTESAPSQIENYTVSEGMCKRGDPRSSLTRNSYYLLTLHTVGAMSKPQTPWYHER